MTFDAYHRGVPSATAARTATAAPRTVGFHAIWHTFATLFVRPRVPR